MAQSTITFTVEQTLCRDPLQWEHRFAATLLKQSSLANHMPGTVVKLRPDDDGFLVRVGKRESHYRSFVAH